MKKLRIAAHYDAPIERVFELGTDFARYPEWNMVYTDVREITGPSDAVGTRIHATMRFLGRSMDGWAEIVEVDRPWMLRFSGSSREGGSLSYRYDLARAGEGTDFVVEVEYELPAGLFGQIADKLFLERAVERQLRHAIENFKALVETPEAVLV